MEVKVIALVGNFDGNNKEIKNIYINREENDIAFFGNATCKIKNFTLSGIIRAMGVVKGRRVGGISVAYSSGARPTIENCCNKADIYANLTESGEVGGISNNAGYVKQCVNEGNIILENQESPAASSISGIAKADNIINCYNTGNITGKDKNREYNIGGISTYQIENIMNCYNLGNIKIENSKTSDRIGGIVAEFRSTIKNCYNLGNLGGRSKC